MSEFQYKSIQPFIPSGKDYEASRCFFIELGFVELWETKGVAGFHGGECGFILQDYDDAEFASNLMMKLVVSNLDDWWTTIQSKSLETRYPSVRLKPPAQYSWGSEAVMVDPAGVCWHVSER